MLKEIFPITLPNEDFKELVRLLVDNEEKLKNLEDIKIDEKLFTGICACVERFLYGKASYDIILKWQN